MDYKFKIQKDMKKLSEMDTKLLKEIPKHIFDFDEFTKEIEISLFRLDENWLEHPNLFAKYAEKAQTANTEVMNAKLNLDKVKAKTYLRVKAEGGLTDKAATAKVDSDIKVLTALRVYNKCNGIYQTLFNVAIRTLEHRKTTLENLVKLYASEYFAVPKAERREDRQLKKVAARNKAQRFKRGA